MAHGTCRTENVMTSGRDVVRNVMTSRRDVIRNVKERQEGRGT